MQSNLRLDQAHLPILGEMVTLFILYLLAWGYRAKTAPFQSEHLWPI